MQKRLMTISDISCLGKCSLTTALPIISALGHECCVLPTSLLSAHTAVYPEYTFFDMSQPMEDIVAHFGMRQVKFDGILTGYLTGPNQTQLVSSFIDTFHQKDTPVVVDPILGDHGRLYAGFTDDHVAAARSLCSKADYILPNLTEAALLLGKPLETTVPTLAQVESLAKELTQLQVERVIITGVPNEDTIGIAGYDTTTKQGFHYFTPCQQGIFHGTGDIFAATFFGALCLGLPWVTAAKRAADFTSQCVQATADDPTARSYGTNFEGCLTKIKECIKGGNGL